MFPTNGYMHMCMNIYMYVHVYIYIHIYPRLDPGLTGLSGVRPAVGFYGSGREPVLDVRCLLEAECTRIGV